MAKPNGEYKIEKGVPIPMNWRTKYPFAEMRPGDSFKGSQKVVSAVSYWAKRHPGKGKFTCRREGDGYRVWRIE